MGAGARPRAHVVPPEVAAHGDEVGRLFHDRVVDADLFERRVDAVERGAELPFVAEGGKDAVEDRAGQLRTEAAERLFERGDAPDEHPAVPHEASARHVRRRGAEVRLFDEARDLAEAGRGTGTGEGRAEFDVAVAGGRARRGDADEAEDVAPGADAGRGGERRAEARRVGNQVVGREDAERGVRTPAAVDERRRERARRGGVAPLGLAEHAVGPEHRKRLPRGGHEVARGDDEDARGRDEPAKAVHGVADERLAAEKVHELLGTGGAAERPEPLAAAAGEDDGVELGNGGADGLSGGFRLRGGGGRLFHRVQSVVCRPAIARRSVRGSE